MFMDDDIVLSLHRWKGCSRQSVETLATALWRPIASTPPSHLVLVGRSTIYAGAIFSQDETVARFSWTTTAMGGCARPKRSSEKVWEPAFLSRLFPALGRRSLIQSDNVVYHLDYKERETGTRTRSK